MSSLPQIRDEWRVPARPGQRVAVDPGSWYEQEGTIVGSEEDRLVVRLDSGRRTYPRPDDVAYLTTR